MTKALAIVPDLAAVEALGTFDGRDVSGTSIRITNAGDGLSQALKVDPTEFHIGERVYVVLETVVAKVEHAPVEDDGADDGPLIRAHTLRAGAATIVDADLVAEQLRIQTVRIKAALERAAKDAHGVQVVPGTGWEDEESALGLYDDPDDVDPAGDES